MDPSIRQELKQILLAARLYYQDRLTQEDVAKEMGLSRPTVSRLINRAHEEGIVRTIICDPFESREDLAGELEQAAGLSKVLVCPDQPVSVNNRLRWLGLAAARHLEETLTPDSLVGVGWGRTLYAVAQALAPHPVQGIKIAPLVGGLGQVSASFQVHEIARLLAEAFNGQREQLYVPALVEDAAVKSGLLSSQDVRQVVQLWDQISVALVGIGNVGLDAEITMLFPDYLDEKTRLHLKRARAVGDICMRFFDGDGQFIPDVFPGIIGIDVSQLRRIPRLIAVAGGADKADAILGAVRSGCIHTLVTDESAARKVLSLLKG